MKEKEMTLKQSNLTFLAIAILIVVLSACTSVKKELGIARNSPDEFTVIKRAPLTLPPEYNLKPPVDKNDVANEDVLKSKASNVAKQAIIGKSVEKQQINEADDLLLSKMGANDADPNIRAQIDKDNGYILLKNQTLIEKLTSKDDVELNINEIPASRVDPKAEAARIKKNMEENKPLNEGDVPVIEKKLGTLDKLF